ncbi:MAG TPA: hemolysin family protein [Thermoanaerobaculia bacterium]|nr:hemolysin family protein [Thermoanaerobaculia bacterium]
MAELGVGLVATGVAALVMALLAILTALVERSGPIRLRHWAEEAGGGLRVLYTRTPRFEAFRFLLSVLARLAAIAVFALLLHLLLVAGAAGGFAWAVGGTALWLAAVEVLNRHLVGRQPELALRRLTPLYRALHLPLRPLLPLMAPLLPRPEGETTGLEEATRGEIEAYVDLGRREGILEAGEEELLRGLVHFGDTQVRSVMTPRIDVVCAPLTAAPGELVEIVLRSGHSRIPLYRESIDDIVGFVHVRDLLRIVHRGGANGVEAFLQPIHVVPETKSLALLLRELQERHQEVAAVVDEYGGTQGLVTIEDLLEEIFGEISDEHDRAEPEEVQLPDGSWRVDGRTHLEELEELLDVRIEHDEWETVGGLVFGLLGHIPRVGESVVAHGLQFLVEGADERRARRVRISRLQPPVAAPEEA